MSIVTKLTEELEKAGLDPATGQPTEGEDNAEQDQGTDTEGRADGEGDDTGGESEEPADGEESDGGESEPDAESLTSEQEEAIEGGKGMVEIPASLLKKLRKEKTESSDKYNTLLQGVMDQKDNTINDQNTVIQQILTPKQEAEPATIPDPLTNPDEYNVWFKGEMAKVQKANEDSFAQVQQATRQMQIDMAVDKLENTYESQNPGFKERKQAFVNKQVEETFNTANIFDPTFTKAKAVAAVNQKAKLMENAFINQGMDPSAGLTLLMDQQNFGIDVKEESKPNLNKINENQKRQKSLSKGGKEKGVEKIVQTFADYDQLSRSEKKAMKVKMGHANWKKMKADMLKQARENLSA